MSTHFDLPITCLITAGKATPENYQQKRDDILGIIRIAAECGISLVQIREKRLTTKLLYSLVSDSVAITSGTKTRLLVNDRADVAAATDADGVHLTAGSMPTHIVRRCFSLDMLIGVSVHSVEAAVDAARDGADFVIFAPVFATPGKGKPTGLFELADVCRKLAPFPVLALGGIDETNYGAVLDAGASGFAAIRFLNDADRLRQIASELQLRPQ